jgi:magnesium and cobalt transporter
LITSEFGHLPEVGEKATIGAYLFQVTAANDRRVQQFRVSRQSEA